MRRTPLPAPAVALIVALALAAPPVARRAAAESPAYLWGTPPTSEPEAPDLTLAWLPAEPAAAPHTFEDACAGVPEVREELPEPVTRVIPDYPALAREAGIGGLVVAEARVGTDGHVLEARVDERHSVGLLDEAALDALRQWVFRPARTNLTPVAVWVAVPFQFHLH